MVRADREPALSNQRKAWSDVPKFLSAAILVCGMESFRREPEPAGFA